jgi:proline iminopeptidase
MHDGHQSRMVDIGDTALFVVERGRGEYPIVMLHGGPGDDHHEFGDYLDPLGDRCRLLLVDQRGQGRSAASDERTWSLSQMAADVVLLAKSLGLERYAVLGHSYGAFVALQNAVDFPGQASLTIVSAGVPSLRFLEQVDRNLETFEPVELREQVAASWSRETEIETEEEFAELMHDQLPFHFADPRDPRIGEYERRAEGAKFSPRVLRTFAAAGYGAIDLEDRLGEIEHPVLVLAGRHDRTCPVEAAEVMAHGIPNAELVVFEHSAHMMFVEEPALYVAVVREFLTHHAGG